MATTAANFTKGDIVGVVLDADQVCGCVDAYTSQDQGLACGMPLRTFHAHMFFSREFGASEQSTHNVSLGEGSKTQLVAGTNPTFAAGSQPPRSATDSVQEITL